jgi:hypothetical protein
MIRLFRMNTTLTVAFHTENIFFRKVVYFRVKFTFQYASGNTCFVHLLLYHDRKYLCVVMVLWTLSTVEE